MSRNTDSSISGVESCTSFSRWIREYREIVFLSLVAGMSVVTGFATSLTLTRRRDSEMFEKGLAHAQGSVAESGASLAVRALSRGSLLAVGGFSVFCAVVWKLSDAHSMKEFGAKVHTTMGRVVRRPADDTRPRGRSEFATVRELVNYLIDEDERQKTSTVDSSNNDA